jgi:hypothetical protein
VILLCPGCDDDVKDTWMSLYNGRWYCSDCYNEITAVKKVLNARVVVGDKKKGEARR